MSIKDEQSYGIDVYFCATRIILRFDAKTAKLEKKESFEDNVHN
jgi:hypothetical protein